MNKDLLVEIMDTLIRKDRMELALVAAVIDLEEKCQRKEGTIKILVKHNEEENATALLLDRKRTIEKMRSSPLLTRNTATVEFSLTRRNGVCEMDELERVLVSKTLRKYKKLQHLDLNY